MKLKKNPKANLENYSKLFVQLGLILALFISFLAIEYKTSDRPLYDYGKLAINDIPDIEIPEIIREKPKVIPPATPPPTIEIIDDSKNDVIEDAIKPTDVDENEKIDFKKIIIVDDDMDEDDDIPFPIIENAPIYPGCEDMSKSEQKKCLSNSITKLVNKKFDSNLASELGLTSGKKRIFVMFKIDKTGKVIDIRARAPHARLEKEAVRVINLIPKMTPGKQRGRAVGVKYSLPIVFNVQD